MRRAAVESSFEKLLDANKIPPAVVGLFAAIVRDVWRDRAVERSNTRRTLEQRRRKFEERKDALVQAHVFQKTIDSHTYLEHVDKIDRELSEIDTALADTEARDRDIDRVIEFSKIVLCGPGGFWRSADIDGKQRFQTILYPDGLSLGADGFGTAPTPIVFSHLKTVTDRKSSLASPAGFEPALPP